MSRKLASVSLATLVLTVAMGLKTVAASHGDGFVMKGNGVAPAPLNGPDPTPAPWKHGLNGPDPTPAPWKKG